MLYVAYRLGALPWKAKEGISPADFGPTLEDFLAEKVHYGWSVRRQGEPRLIAFGVDAAPGTLFVGDVVWHPKASPREKLEHVAALLDALRRDMVAIFAFEHKHKAFYERLIDYHIARRVGTLYGLTVAPDRLSLLQTRTLK